MPKEDAIEQLEKIIEDKIWQVLEEVRRRADAEQTASAPSVVTWPDNPANLVRDNGRVDFDVAVIEIVKLLTEIRDLLQTYVR